MMLMVIGHVKPQVHNNEEMAFYYTEVLVLLVKKVSMKILLAKGTAHRNKKLFHIKTKVYKCTNFVLDRLN